MHHIITGIVHSGFHTAISWNIELPLEPVVLHFVQLVQVFAGDVVFLCPSSDDLQVLRGGSSLLLVWLGMVDDVAVVLLARQAGHIHLYPPE